MSLSTRTSIPSTPVRRGRSQSPTFPRSPRLLLAATVAAALGSIASLPAQTIPLDPAATCVLTPAEFGGWFQTGAPTLNGVVKPANGITFPNTGNCDFYKWSEQMFLWMTSPASTAVGGTGRIFDSPTFFDVSPPDANRMRTFIPNAPNQMRALGVRLPKPGPNGLPLMHDKQGRALELQRPNVEFNGPVSIRDKSGAMVEISQAKYRENKAPLLMNKEGQEIETAPTPQPPPSAHTDAPIPVQRFVINHVPIFLDQFGNVVDVEQGQADGGVLQAQNGSLVFYGIAVNDVYAYFRSSQSTPPPAGLQFPTTPQDLAAITAFAATHNKTFPDPNALAIEIKTSWVEAANLPNPADYITMTATIPAYDTTNPATLWTPIPNGEKTVLMALVGVHVVGSVAGHPEMIRATFEHVGNAPDAAYSYINTAGQVTNVPQSTGGKWLFCADNAVAPFNAKNMIAQGLNIALNPDTATPPFKMGPSNVIRWKPWGAASDLTPNPLVTSTAQSNSEVISINDSVRGMLLPADVRSQYIMSGATWTKGGQAPSSTNQVGTSLLCNTTMETFVQGNSNLSDADSTNCFSCHGTNTTSVSHVFSKLKPLFP